MNDYQEWEGSVPTRMKEDPLWKSQYYRYAMYLYDFVWADCDVLKKDFRGREIARQLIRSSGSISANIEEAYGRGVGTADYVRILRIALGEARETQGWYLRSRHLLSSDIIDERLDVISQVISMLVNAISTQKKNISKKR